MTTLLFLCRRVLFFSVLFSVFDFNKTSRLRLYRHPLQLANSGLQRGRRFLLKNSSPGSEPGRIPGEVDFWYKDSRSASKPGRTESQLSKQLRENHGSTIMETKAQHESSTNRLQTRCRHIRPFHEPHSRKACDNPLTDTVAALEELFGHNTSVFVRRHPYLITQRNEESLRDYTGLVNQRHDMAEFNDVTPEQMKCLVWICELVAPQDADVRVRTLRTMEKSSLAEGPCRRSSALCRHLSGSCTPRTIKSTARQRRGFAKKSNS
ncbi:hypothetical protein RB195_018644 [Necator americanus]|uniref:Uncharacterized protein n=1 Tax=Necator americanus TaxID=51031 RepID=A0ABR1CCA8_NECAM